jgi:hypothetical protein
MQRAMRHSLFASLITGACVLLGAAPGRAGDWGVRLVGDLGSTPKSLARTFFDAGTSRFEYGSRGLELGVAWRDWDAGIFLYTANKGYFERGYSVSACGPWRNGEWACTPNGTTLREGTVVQPVGVRMLGVRVGRFVTLARPKKWLRFGLPLHVGLATYTGKKAVQDTWTRGIEQTATGEVFYERYTRTELKGGKVFASGGPPYPIVSAGIGAKVRTASWAEFEVCLKAENPRLPVLSWGMTFRKQSK